ncbi:MAG: cytochrome c biogenesis protein CcsA [Pseudomonadota bacterium]
MTASVAGLPSVFLYIMGATLALMRIRAPAQDAFRGPLLISVSLAVVSHGILLYVLNGGHEAVNLSFFSMLSAAAWLTVVLVLIGTLVRPVLNLGIVIFPLTALCVSLQMVWGRQPELMRTLDWQINVHAALSVFAFAILSIGAAQALLILLQDRALRSGATAILSNNLPPLQRMEQLLFQLIGMGFILLTLALVSGMLFVEDLMAQHLVHKTVLSICAWVVFGLLLWGRWQFGWRGRTAVRLTLAGATALVLAYFGSKLVLEVILDRVD